MDPTTGTFPGDAWDGGTGTWPGVAGGACIYDDTTHGLVLGGMHQASPDNVCVYSLVPDPLPQIDVKVNGLDAGVVVPDTSNVIQKDVDDVEIMKFSGFTEDFDDGVADGWVDDGPHWSVGNGTYNLDCPSFVDWFSYYDVFAYSDFTYTAEMRMLQTTSYSDTYDRGIYFRHDGSQMNGYEIYIQNDGWVYFYLHVNSGSGSNQFSQVSPNLVQGVGNWNTISVDARGSNFDVFINGVLDFTWTDTTFTSGKVGLMGQGSGGYDHDYEFDNVTLVL